MTNKKIFWYETNSNAAPFFSDYGSGFIEAENPRQALEKIVKEYKHPAGLFAVTVRAPTPEQPVLAKYLSARAATQEKAPCGLTQWKEDGLYVDGEKVPEQKEKYEINKKIVEAIR
jgi:hypothetical protein